MSIHEYYVFQTNYWKLKKLLELLRTPKTESSQLIRYMKKNKLDVNSYIPLNSDGTIYVPIIYQTTLIPTLTEFFKWLIKNGAKADKEPDTDEGVSADNILFVAHEKYLKFLTNTLKLKIDRLDLAGQLLKKLKFGNLKRIRQLIALDVFSVSDLHSAISSSDTGELAFSVIDIMLDRINLICRTANKREDIEKVLTKYVEIIGLIKPDPLVERECITLIQYCTNFYLHPIIAELMKTQITLKPVPEIKYHADLDEKLVAILRQLYNDRRYVETCDLIGVVPDKRAF